MVGEAVQRVAAPRSLAATSLPVVRYQHIDALFGDNVVDWELIQTHWQDLLRVVISIQEGKVLPSMLLRKLTTYMVKSAKVAHFSPQNLLTLHAYYQLLPTD